MGKKTKSKPTSIVLGPTAQDIKAHHVNTYGLKNLITVGLVLFDQLTAEQREELINQITTQEGNGSVQVFVTPAEQKILDFARSLGPDAVIQLLTDAEKVRVRHKQG